MRGAEDALFDVDQQRVGFLGLAQGLEPRHAWHGEIDQQEIRFDCPNDADRLFACSGLAYNLEPEADVDLVDLLDDGRRHGEHVPQARSKHRFVV